MPPETGRPRDPDVDVRIIDAARDLLDAEGPGAVTVTAVAKRAGVGRPTVYRRYADADDLLRAVLFAELEAISAEQRRLGIPDGPLVDRLVAMARPSMDYYAGNPERGRALLRTAILAEPVWQEKWNALNGEIGGTAGQVVVEAIASGELRQDADLVLVVSGFMFLLMSVLIAGLTGALGPVDAWETFFRRMLAQYLVGLDGPAAAEGR